MLKVSHILFGIAFCLGVVFFSSCKKEKKTDPFLKGTVTADVDGVATDFSSFAIAVTGSSNGNDFTAVQGDAKDGSSIGLTVYGAIIAGKTYTPENQEIGTRPILTYSTGDDDFLTDFNNPSVTITITGVSSSSIQGTFSGSVTDITPGANQGKTKVITSGKFNVQR